MRERIPIMTVLLNNSVHGRLRPPHADRQRALRLEPPLRRLRGVAKGLGAYAERVENPDDVVAAIQRGIAGDAEGRPVVLEMITKEEPVYPAAPQAAPGDRGARAGARVGSAGERLFVILSKRSEAKDFPDPIEVARGILPCAQDDSGSRRASWRPQVDGAAAAPRSAPVDAAEGALFAHDSTAAIGHREDQQAVGAARSQPAPSGDQASARSSPESWTNRRSPPPSGPTIHGSVGRPWAPAPWVRPARSGRCQVGSQQVRAGRRWARR